jgi:hypothetical protein
MDNSLGRYWGSADKAELTSFNDDTALFRLSWDDGKNLVVDGLAKQEAIDWLNRLGFRPER